MLFDVGAIVISYLIGAIPVGYVIGKIKGVDIREHGSGNIGTTNVWRTLGKVPGIFTFLGDAAKGVAAVLIGMNVGGQGLEVICGLAALAGHSWPVYLGFKGGKIIATGLGVLVALSYEVALLTILVWLVTVGLTRYISLGSILAAISVPVLMYIFNPGNFYMAFGVFAAVFAVLKHRSNIERLIKGTEFKLGEEKNKNK